MPMLDLVSGAVTEPGPGFRMIEIDPARSLEATRAAPDDAVLIKAPGFKDGRIFTAIRLLRERVGHKGPIIAAGPLLPDQAAFLRRVGASHLLLDDEDRVADIRFALKVYDGVFPDGREEAA
ncbi:MAG: DUF934 domain-containing protein [Parvularcula sp.]|jgi:uncharacterized protein (DUF934 family)|nr:DUF934 domain-containing protein [Parvularcula sp.]